MVTLSELGFRQNVDPQFRREANKNISEYNRLRESLIRQMAENKRSREAFVAADIKRLNLERTHEEGKKELALVQAVIDAEYLPEGAQPIDRIKNRNKISSKVEQQRINAEKQRELTDALSDALKGKDHDLFVAERGFHRYGEILQQTMRDLNIISDLDNDKLSKVETIQMKNAELVERKTILRERRREDEINAAEEKEKEKSRSGGRGRTVDFTGLSTGKTRKGFSESKSIEGMKYGPVMDELDLFTARMKKAERAEKRAAKSSVDGANEGAGGPEEMAAEAAADISGQDDELAGVNLDDPIDDNASVGSLDDCKSLKSQRVGDEDFDSDSDDEEDDDLIPTSMQNTTIDANYQFYEFGKTSHDGQAVAPLTDLLDQISRVKMEAKYASKSGMRSTRGGSSSRSLRSMALSSSDKRSPDMMAESLDDVAMVGTTSGNELAYTSTFRPNKTFCTKEYQDTQVKTKNAIPHHYRDKISQFKIPPQIWDGSFNLDPEMDKTIWRVPDSDPSGYVIRGVKRDEKKGGVPWRTVAHDNPLPEPTMDMCNHKFQDDLEQHFDYMVAKVEAEWETIPAVPAHNTTLKAAVGADLFVWKTKQNTLSKTMTMRRTEK